MWKFNGAKIRPRERNIEKIERKGCKSQIGNQVHVSRCEHQKNKYQTESKNGTPTLIILHIIEEQTAKVIRGNRVMEQQ